MPEFEKLIVSPDPLAVVTAEEICLVMVAILLPPARAVQSVMTLVVPPRLTLVEDPL